MGQTQSLHDETPPGEFAGTALPFAGLFRTCRQQRTRGSQSARWLRWVMVTRWASPRTKRVFMLTLVEEWADGVCPVPKAMLQFKFWR